MLRHRWILCLLRLKCLFLSFLSSDLALNLLKYENKTFNVASDFDFSANELKNFVDDNHVRTYQKYFI
jgi:hypothetical protein